MATDDFRYLSYPEAAEIHIRLMRHYGEERFGVFDRTLVESALARPRQAAVYENADLIRQAATLCFGLIKNHPWVGGNKRTATTLMRAFLRLNGSDYQAATAEKLALVFAIESDQYKVDEIDNWLRQRIT